MALRILLAVCICGLTATAYAGKKKKKPSKPKREPKPLVRGQHHQIITSGTKTHEVTFSVTRAEKGVTGYIFAIYKNNGGGGVYTCQKEEFKIEAPKPDKNKQKKKNAIVFDKGPKRKPLKYTFPHSNGKGTFIDYLVVVYQGGKLVSRASKTSIWKNAAEKLVENSDAAFNSRGESVEADAEGEGESRGHNDDVVKAGLQLKKRIEMEEKNRKMEKEMNK